MHERRRGAGGRDLWITYRTSTANENDAIRPIRLNGARKSTVSGHASPHSGMHVSHTHSWGSGSAPGKNLSMLSWMNLRYATHDP
jgi:hypothetical protein